MIGKYDIFAVNSSVCYRRKTANAFVDRTWLYNSYEDLNYIEINICSTARETSRITLASPERLYIRELSSSLPDNHPLKNFRTSHIVRHPYTPVIFIVFDVFQPAYA